MSKPKYSQNFIRIASLLQAAEEIPGIAIMVHDPELFGKFINGMHATDKMEIITMSQDERGNSILNFVEQQTE